MGNLKWICRKLSKKLEFLHMNTKLWAKNREHLNTVLALKRQTSDRNVKTGWYHAREDTLPPFFLPFVWGRKWGRVHCLAWYQPVLTFRSLVWRFGPGTVVSWHSWIKGLSSLTGFYWQFQIRTWVNAQQQNIGFLFWFVMKVKT